MKNFLILLLAVLLAMLSACSTVNDFSYLDNEKPALDLKTWFNGTLDARGMFQDRSGKVVKRFHVEILCSWQGDTGTLDENFLYADGTRERRVWTLRKTGPNRFTGTAPDVVGEASGIVSGNALHWNYVLALPVDGHIVNVDFDDLMVLMDDKVMLNHATMSKFGIRLGEVTLSFQQRAQVRP
ncbi:MAG: putative lipoprotein [Herminiimonas sp.]|nr:putative lipoprotein [Herminiimonas sp.]